MIIHKSDTENNRLESITVENTDTSTQDSVEEPTTDTTADTTTEKSIEESTTTLSNLATKSNLILILTFLGIYFIVYFVLGKFFNKGENPNGFNVSLSRTLDVMFFGFLIVIIFLIIYLIF